MRRALVLLLLALACCDSGPEPTVDLETACVEQAVAWCDYFARCEGGGEPYPSCHPHRIQLCLAGQIGSGREPLASELDTCVAALEAGECAGPAWWPAECD